MVQYATIKENEERVYAMRWKQAYYTMLNPKEASCRIVVIVNLF